MRGFGRSTVQYAWQLGLIDRQDCIAATKLMLHLSFELMLKSAEALNPKAQTPNAKGATIVRLPSPQRDLCIRRVEKAKSLA